MISYSRDPQDTVPPSSVKIIGLGGAGANVLERIALDGLEGTELLALSGDARTLGACLAKEKIQLGVNLTRGLGTGGDPELGRQAALEAEEQIRMAIQGHRIVFLCAGLGGGSGSGAAPIVARIAREEGAFVVAFVTMPFAFEGKRRQDQAEAALNELAVLSNALVTFDNNRMGELVLAKQGVHEAFTAANQLISESIKAVIRLVVRPGLINVGLDDLISALRTNRSRCLFGSGIADGKDRASKALRNALASPLLDQGALLKEAQSVLVHLCGGEDLTLFEIELLMQNLQKFVPESAHILFGAAVDPTMGDSLSLTLVSALPEDALTSPRETPSLTASTSPAPTLSPIPASEPPAAAPEVIAAEIPPLPTAVEPEAPSLFEMATPLPTEPEEEFIDETLLLEEAIPALAIGEFTSVKTVETAEPDLETAPADADEDFPEIPEMPELPVVRLEPAAAAPQPLPWSATPSPKETFADATPAPASEPEAPKLKLGIKSGSPQSELSLDSSPRGRFEGEKPNVFEGEDLDLPPFLRKKK